jgi:hypothetical protein
MQVAHRPGDVLLVNACCLMSEADLSTCSGARSVLHVCIFSLFRKARVLLLQGNEGDVRWHCAMLDVLSALLRLCGSCRAIAVASLAAAGHAPAAQPTQASGIFLTAFCEYYR